MTFPSSINQLPCYDCYSHLELYADLLIIYSGSVNTPEGFFINEMGQMIALKEYIISYNIKFIPIMKLKIPHECLL